VTPSGAGFTGDFIRCFELPFRYRSVPGSIESKRLETVIEENGFFGPAQHFARESRAFPGVLDGRFNEDERELFSARLSASRKP
jgi:hypothetical protein